MTEVDRICDLPRMKYDEPALIAKWTALLGTPGGSFSFFADQAKGLEAAAHARGGLFPITTGGGKTLLSMALPLALGIDPGDVVVLCPPGLETEAAFEREKYLEHFALEPTGTSVRYVPYSTLSREAGVTLLTDLAPRLIIADEAHCLKNKKAARTNRFLKFMKRNPDCLFVGMSGTFYNGALYDFAHLAQLALRENSPLPSHYNTLAAWGRCVDVMPQMPATKQDWYVFNRLKDEFCDLDPLTSTPREQGRNAFRNRLKTAPGVVVSDGDSCSTALVAHMLKDGCPMPDAVVEAIKAARNELVLPNGLDIDTPMHAAEKSKQLSLGWYYYPDWPNGVVDMDWVYTRREYMSALWQFVKVGRHGLDTPGLVEQQLRAGTLNNTSLVRLWGEWQKHAWKPEPPVKPQWIDESIMQWYLEQARCIRDTHGPVLIWCGHVEEQRWLAEHGVPANTIGKRPEHGPEVGIASCSIASHGTGYNLQAWNQNLVLCPPSNAGMWQQMLARTHRAGQTQDVHVWIAQHSTPFRNAWRKARLYAQGIENTMESVMKIEHMVWPAGRIVWTEFDPEDRSSIFD